MKEVIRIKEANGLLAIEQLYFNVKPFIKRFLVLLSKATKLALDHVHTTPTRIRSSTIDFMA